MSKLTNFLDRSTSMTFDVIASMVLGAAAGVGVAILPLDWVPLIGPYLPYAAAGVGGAAVYIRQRRNVNNAAPPGFARPG